MEEAKFQSADVSGAEDLQVPIFFLLLFCFYFSVPMISYFSQVKRIPVPRLCLPVDLRGPALQDTPNQQYYPTINTEIPLGTSLCTQVSSEIL